MNAETVFINLKILSALPPYARLNTCHELFQIEVDNTWSISWVWRLLRGDNRREAVKRIDSLVDSATAYIAEASGKEKARMRQHVAGAKQGCNNLRETYRKDYTTLASLDRILDKMECVED